MRARTYRRRSHAHPIKDRTRQIRDKNASSLPGVILFAAVIGVFPLAHMVDWVVGASWLASILGAIAISAILAVVAFMLIDS